MQKKNYIVESMYTKYTDRTDVQKKKLNESAQDMWVLVPSQNRYDDPIDVMKFAKEYGVFDSMSKAFDKAEELAPDRWDAFVPVRLSESLTEARNPENDEVNSIIRKHGVKNNLSKKEWQILNKHGIHKDNESSILDGPEKWLTRYDIRDYDKESGGDFDFANYLTKKRNPAPGDEFDQMKSLQPYKQEKKEILRAGQKARQAQKDLQNAEDEKKQIMKSVQDKKASRKNESLSLNESSGTEYEIYFSDLTPEAQADLLDFVGIASPKELNWDVYPIAMLFDFSDELEEI